MGMWKPNARKGSSVFFPETNGFSKYIQGQQKKQRKTYPLFPAYIYLKGKKVFIYRYVCGQAGIASVGGGLRIPTRCPARGESWVCKKATVKGTSPQHVTKDCPDS